MRYQRPSHAPSKRTLRALVRCEIAARPTAPTTSVTASTSAARRPPYDDPGPLPDPLDRRGESGSARLVCLYTGVHDAARLRGERRLSRVRWMRLTPVSPYRSWRRRSAGRSECEIDAEAQPGRGQRPARVPAAESTVRSDGQASGRTGMSAAIRRARIRGHRRGRGGRRRARAAVWGAQRLCRAPAICEDARPAERRRVPGARRPVRGRETAWRQVARTDGRCRS